MHGIPKRLVEAGDPYEDQCQQGFKDVVEILDRTDDCLETLEEIAMQYRDLFLNAGGERFDYIPALIDSQEHIHLFAAIIEQKLAASNT